jgi:hypothetical protein
MMRLVWLSLYGELRLVVGEVAGWTEGQAADEAEGLPALAQVGLE